MKQMCWLADMKYILENPFVICHLLPARDFVSRCKTIGISTSEEQLEKLEKLGIFYPFARVQYPDHTKGFIDIWSQKEPALNWLEMGRIWDPSTKPFQEWKTFRKEGSLFDSIISFYSIFQFYPLYALTQNFTADVHYEYFVDYDSGKREELIKFHSYYAEFTLAAYQRKEIGFKDQIKKYWYEDLKNKAMWRAIAAKMCQIISNRYYPETQSDGRSIRMSIGLRNNDWNWYQYCRDWNAKAVLDEIGLDIKELKALHKIVAFEAKKIDPLENWYELVRYISVDKKKKLKGTALLAQDIYSMETMLRLFYDDLANEKLPYGEVPPFVDVNKFYGIDITENISDHLEFITNEFNINPKPNLILVVEGDGEEQQFPRLARELLGYSFSILGIEIRNLKGVGNFTGKKRLDKYGALEKFIDDYHFRQTIVFIILDNEGRAREIRDSLIKRPSTTSPGQTVTKGELIRIWARSIEFDNFSNEEIAKAMTELCNHEHEFNLEEIGKCKTSYDAKKGDPLEDLFEDKATACIFNKTKLLKILFDNLISNQEKELDENNRRPVVNWLIDAIQLASLNNQPFSNQIKQYNQESGFLRDKAKY